jgi:hypothetical protein
MRNSTKKGGAVKYQNGGSKKPMMMNPSKIAVGPTKKMTDAQKKAYMDKLKKQVEKGYKAPKKQMGGIIPSKPIATAPIQGKTGRRGAAGSNMAKGGQKFPDLTGDGKVTKKDILKGRGVIKQNGGGMDDVRPTGGDARRLDQYRHPELYDLEMSPYEYSPLELVDKVKTIYLKDAMADIDRKYNKVQWKKKGGQKHPGFKAVQAKIAAKQGVSKKAAGAILAASSRKASAKAKAANPRLKRVKG